MAKNMTNHLQTNGATKKSNHSNRDVSIIDMSKFHLKKPVPSLETMKSNEPVTITK